MYKINNSFQATIIVNPNLIENERIGLTNSQIEIENNKFNNDIYFQDTIPTTNIKYWKLVDGVVVSMTESEIIELDEFNRVTAINDSFHNFIYKVNVFDLQSALKTLVNGEAVFNNYNNLINDALVPNQEAIVLTKKVYMNPPSLQLRIEAEVYLNFIDIPALSGMSSVKTLADDGVTEVDLITIEMNEAWDYFNDNTEVDTTANIIIE